MYFNICCKSQDPVTRENAAFNFPCIFDIFAKSSHSSELDFPLCLKAFTKTQEAVPIRCIVGSQMHEIFRICDKYSLDFYLFVPAFSNLLNSDLLEVQFSVLKHLAVSINLINKNFKY